MQCINYNYIPAAILTGELKPISIEAALLPKKN